MSREDIHEKDRAYLQRCQKAAGYCAERLGWRVIECCKDGQMRGIDEIQREISAIASPLLG